VSGEAAVAHSRGPGPALARALTRRRGARSRSRSRTRLYVALAVLAAVLLASLLAPLLGLPAPNDQDLGNALQSPSLAHPFGTDEVGRDVFSRTLSAAKLDLAAAVSVTLLSMVLGTALGALAGFFGRAVDGVVMRLADIVLAFPFLVLVLAVAAVLGPGLTAFFVGVPIVGWAVYARLTRAEMLVVREKEYIQAAKTLGFSRRRTVLRHAGPNVWRPAFVYSTADVVMNITLLATLSYLGVGVRPPTPEWGGVIADGQQFLLEAWWITTLPGFAVVLVGICFAVIGDALADLLGEEVRFAA
jgi:peptide/nickel transport system permease protein